MTSRNTVARATSGFVLAAAIVLGSVAPSQAVNWTPKGGGSDHGGGAGPCERVAGQCR